MNIQIKLNCFSFVIFSQHSGNDDDIFAEALRFQKQLQVKSTEEAQNILKTNLEQIAKVSGEKTIIFKYVFQGLAPVNSKKDRQTKSRNKN